VRTALFVIVIVMAAAGCAHRGAVGGTAITLRAACAASERWDGTACVALAGVADVEAGREAIARYDMDTAVAALERSRGMPFDHANNILWWEQRGIAHAYLDQPSEAVAAFDHLLLIDPAHLLSYELSTKATLAFAQARAAAEARGAPMLDVQWRRDQRLGEAVPIEVETVADPGGILKKATIYVRARGESAWRAADFALAAPGKVANVRLPAVAGTKSITLEMYAVASDDTGTEVLTWASPGRPREIALRYDPPTPWYRKWWVWAAAGGVVAVGTGIIVYATVWEPGPVVGGGIDVP
jgi:hypothetical protein